MRGIREERNTEYGKMGRGRSENELEREEAKEEEWQKR